MVVVALFAARLLASQKRKNNAPEQAPPQGIDRTSKASDGPESMVRCAHCGIYMPRSEAVLSDGKTWCSPEHAKLGIRQ